MAAPKTYAELLALLPDASIEEVGERHELVIYTGLKIDKGALVPMGDD